MNVVRVFIFDGEVIENVPELWSGANLAAAHAGRANRMDIAQRPVDNVQVMDVLFANVIAGKPGEVEPVANLPFEVGHLRGSGGVPKTALVPVTAGAGDGAKRPVVDFFHGFEVLGLIAALEAGDDRQLMAVGFLVRLKHAANARTIHGDGLLRENVLAGRDGGTQMDRPKARRRCQNHQVDVIDNLLISVQSDVDPIIRNVHSVTHGLIVTQPIPQCSGPVAEGIAHGYQTNIDLRIGQPASAETLFDGARTAPAATDDADAQRIAALRMNAKQAARGENAAGRS